MTTAAHRALPRGRCPGCAFPAELCLCARIPRLDLPIRFVILRHASEIPRLSSTARWAALALPGSEIVDYALPGEPVGAAPFSLEGSWVLFPSAHSTEPGSAHPTRVVVPDGTWQQARRMMQRVPALQKLPRLSLPAAAPAPRLRRPPRPGGMSTLEAIAGALRFLGHAEEADRLLDLHAEAVDRASRLRGLPAAIA